MDIEGMNGLAGEQQPEEARPDRGEAPRLAQRESRRRVPRRALRRKGRSSGSKGKPPSLLIALDSEGTVLDSMTPLHELGFGPAFAERFGKGASREAMAEVWRFVGLGSRLRGSNRFTALAAALRLASRRPEIAAALRREEPFAAALEAWLAVEAFPTRERLELALRNRRADPCLRRVLEWSKAADETIAALPLARAFRGAAEILPALSERMELVVLSTTPAAGLLREWDGAGIGGYLPSVASPGPGDAAESLAALVLNRYAPEAILVMGDSPCDLAVARRLGAAFYPITPGREEESWFELAASFLPRFEAGEALRGPVAAFLASLPAVPNWRVRA